MKKQKYLITWYIQLDNGYIDEKSIVCKSYYSARIMYNKILENERVLLIAMDEI
jgi:hypothetical protein